MVYIYPAVGCGCLFLGTIYLWWAWGGPTSTEPLRLSDLVHDRPMDEEPAGKHIVLGVVSLSLGAALMALYLC